MVSFEKILPCALVLGVGQLYTDLEKSINKCICMCVNSNTPFTYLDVKDKF